MSYHLVTPPFLFYVLLKTFWSLKRSLSGWVTLSNWVGTVDVKETLSEGLIPLKTVHLHINFVVLKIGNSGNRQGPVFITRPGVSVNYGSIDPLFGRLCRPTRRTSGRRSVQGVDDTRDPVHLLETLKHKRMVALPCHCQG